MVHTIQGTGNVFIVIDNNIPFDQAKLYQRRFCSILLHFLWFSNKLNWLSSQSRGPWDDTCRPVMALVLARPTLLFWTVQFDASMQTWTVGLSTFGCLVPYGLMIKKMIILKTVLSSRQAHISSKEYFEDTYSKFSK